VFGAVIAAVINFLLVAIVVYFCLIVPINQLQKVRFRKKEDPAQDDPAPPSETELLTEIRDLLKAERAH
jgi:large conductance mechanosensitive channel